MARRSKSKRAFLENRGYEDSSPTRYDPYSKLDHARALSAALQYDGPSSSSYYKALIRGIQNTRQAFPNTDFPALMKTRVDLDTYWDKGWGEPPTSVQAAMNRIIESLGPYAAQVAGKQGSNWENALSTFFYGSRHAQGTQHMGVFGAVFDYDFKRGGGMPFTFLADRGLAALKAEERGDRKDFNPMVFSSFEYTNEEGETAFAEELLHGTMATVGAGDPVGNLPPELSSYIQMRQTGELQYGTRYPLTFPDTGKVVHVPSEELYTQIDRVTENFTHYDRSRGLDWWPEQGHGLTAPIMNPSMPHLWAQQTHLHRNDFNALKGYFRAYSDRQLDPEGLYPISMAHYGFRGVRYASGKRLSDAIGVILHTAHEFSLGIQPDFKLGSEPDNMDRLEETLARQPDDLANLSHHVYHGPITSLNETTGQLDVAPGSLDLGVSTTNLPRPRFSDTQRQSILSRAAAAGDPRASAMLQMARNGETGLEDMFVNWYQETIRGEHAGARRVRSDQWYDNALSDLQHLGGDIQRRSEQGYARGQSPAARTLMQRIMNLYPQLEMEAEEPGYFRNDASYRVGNRMQKGWDIHKQIGVLRNDFYAWQRDMREAQETGQLPTDEVSAAGPRRSFFPDGRAVVDDYQEYGLPGPVSVQDGGAGDPYVVSHPVATLEKDDPRDDPMLSRDEEGKRRMGSGEMLADALSANPAQGTIPRTYHRALQRRMASGRWPRLNDDAPFRTAQARAAERVRHRNAQHNIVIGKLRYPTSPSMQAAQARLEEMRVENETRTARRTALAVRRTGTQLVTAKQARAMRLLDGTDAQERTPDTFIANEKGIVIRQKDMDDAARWYWQDALEEEVSIAAEEGTGYQTGHLSEDEWHRQQAGLPLSYPGHRSPVRSQRIIRSAPERTQTPVPASAGGGSAGTSPVPVSGGASGGSGGGKPPGPPLAPESGFWHDEEEGSPHESGASAPGHPDPSPVPMTEEEQQRIAAHGQRARQQMQEWLESSSRFRGTGGHRPDPRQFVGNIRDRLSDEFTPRGWERHAAKHPNKASHANLGLYRAETGQWHIPGTGEISLSRDEMSEASDVARGALTYATNMPVGGSKMAVFANLNKRMTDFIREWSDQQIAHLEEAIKDPAEQSLAKRQLNKTVVQAREMVTGMLKDIADEESVKDFGDQAYTPQRMAASALRKLTETPGALPETLREDILHGVHAVGGWKQVNKLGGFYGGGDTGDQMYEVRAGADDVRGPLSLFGHPLGRAMQTLYYMKRTWQMLAQPAMQDMAAYGEGQLPLERVAGGVDFGASAGGQGYRAGVLSDWLGQGAFDVVGGFGRISQPMTQSPALGRMAAAGGIGGGLAIAGQLAAAGIPGVVPGLAAAGPIGLIAGGALAAGTVGMEIYNAATGSDVSWTGMINGLADYHAAATWYTGDKGLFVGYNRDLMQYLAQPGTNMAGLVEEYRSQIASGGRLDIDQMNDVADRVSQLSGMKQKEAEDLVAGFLGATGVEGDLSRTVLGNQTAPDILEALTEAANRSGTGLDQMLSQALGYGTSLGYAPGTDGSWEAMSRFAGMDVPSRTRALSTAGDTASRTSMLRQNVSRDVVGTEELSRYAERFETGAQAQRANTYIGAMVAGGLEQRGAMSLGAALAQQPAGTASLRYSTMGTLGDLFGAGGYAAGFSLTTGMNYSQTALTAQIAAGDLGAMSYASHQGMLGSQYRFQDIYGAPLFQTDWSGFLDMGMANAQAGTPGAGMRFGQLVQASASGMTDPRQLTEMFFRGGGVTLPGGAMEALVGGYRGYTGWEAVDQWGSDRRYQAQAAQAGLQAQGVRADMAYYWGSGSWDNPGRGSLWWLEDEQRTMGYRHQQADFAYNARRAQTSNQFALRGEEISERQMAASHDWQRYSLSHQRTQQLQSRQWTREDWQYQDQMTSLNNSWALDDINEAIRLSSGRERRQLVRQRERTTLTQNLEGEHLDETRSRQEQLWAMEDEHYQKSVTYQTELMSLEQERFSLQVQQRETFYEMEKENLKRQKSEYEEQFKLQDQIIALQRQHQAESLERSLQMAGISAGLASEMKELDDGAKMVNDSFGKMTGYMEQISRYDKAIQVAAAMEDLAAKLNKTNVARVWAITRMIGMLD
nr:hypothetical protein [Anaerolineae bacterium]